MSRDKFNTPPKEILDALLTPSWLAESTDFDLIQQNYERSSKTYDNGVEAAHQLSCLIRENIAFSPRRLNQPELTSDFIDQEQKTNCHGFTVIASECLEKLGIDHVVGYANTHSFILMNDHESGNTELIDTPTRNLCVKLAPSIGAVAILENNGEMGSAGYYWGGRVLRAANYWPAEAKTLLPWITFAKGIDAGFRLRNDEDLDNRLILRTYDPTIGRRVLLSYNNFLQAIERHDVNRAHQWIQNLDGTYPEIDRRNRLLYPRHLIRELGMSALASDALEDVQVIDASIRPFTEDLGLILWSADRRRDIGFWTGNQDLIMESLEQYEMTREHREALGQSTRPVDIRIVKAETRLAKLKNRQAHSDA